MAYVAEFAGRKVPEKNPELVIGMESWIRKQQFGQLMVDFEELEFILGELIEESLDVDEIDLEKPIELNFSLKCDEDGCIRVESIGHKFASLSQKILPPESLSSVSENQSQVIFTVELPSVKRNELELKIENNRLIILGGKARQVKKEFFLSPEVEQAISKSIFKNGVLEIVMRKKR